jgi:hypothetical protein
VLRLYGVGGNLLNAVQSLYVDSRACVVVVAWPLLLLL